MSFPRYPKYKDSGVEWLGQVPEHWEVCALKRIVRMQSGESITAEGIQESGEYPVFGGNGLRGYTSVFTHDGHFVLVGRQGALCGNINYGCGKFWASEHAVVASPVKHIETVWLGEMMRAMNLNQYSVSAAQPGLSVDLVSRLATVLPPLPDQTAIATFLDRETAKIDGLVAEQRRLIELLKEKRQAAISHAVTKGLNPHAPMKPSGIEWIGDVPAHWEVMHLRRLVKTGTTITYGIVQAGPDIEDGIPYIRTSDMAGDALPETGYLRTTPEIDASYARSKVSPNDLVVAIRASLGKGLLVPSFLDGANLTQGTARICPGGSLMPRFLLWSFNSHYCQTSIRVVAKGTTFLEITLDALRRVPLAVPPLAEQTAIVSHLDQEVTKLDTLTAEAQRAIELLQERRTALISAAVTGQIDVRNHAPAT